MLESRLNHIEDVTEWDGTTITFDVASQGDKTELLFTHVGLRPAVRVLRYLLGCLDRPYPGSLRQLIETGSTRVARARRRHRLIRSSGPRRATMPGAGRIDLRYSPTRMRKGWSGSPEAAGRQVRCRSRPAAA